MNNSTNSTNTTLNDDLLPIEGIGVTDIVLGIVLATILFGVGTSCDQILMRNVITHRVALFSALAGISIQFIIMPLVAYLLTLIFQIDDTATAIGFIATGCAPSGSLSSQFTNWSNAGILELSVFMSICTTILAFGMIPLTLFIYGEQALGLETDIPYVSLVIGVMLLLVPLFIGALVRKFFPKSVDMIEKVTGVITAVFIIVAVVVVGLDNKQVVTESAWNVWVPAVFYYFIASSLGYFCSAFIFGFKPAVSRTIFFEVGMQNTTLTFSLISLSVRESLAARERALRFPFIYTFFQMFWSVCMVAVFRKHKEHNLENGIVDIDDEFDKMKIQMEQEREQQEVELDEKDDRKEIEGEEGNEEKEEETEFDKIKHEKDEEEKRIHQQEQQQQQATKNRFSSHHDRKHTTSDDNVDDGNRLDEHLVPPHQQVVIAVEDGVQDHPNSNMNENDENNNETMKKEEKKNKKKSEIDHQDL